MKSKETHKSRRLKRNRRLSKKRKANKILQLSKIQKRGKREARSTSTGFLKPQEDRKRVVYGNTLVSLDGKRIKRASYKTKQIMPVAIAAMLIVAVGIFTLVTTLINNPTLNEDMGTAEYGGKETQYVQETEDTENKQGEENQAELAFLKDDKKAIETPEVVEPSSAGTEVNAETPQAIQAPQVTQVPQVTQAPQVTQTPQVTQAPQVTQTPQATQAPQVTQSPAEDPMSSADIQTPDEETKPEVGNPNEDQIPDEGEADGNNTAGETIWIEQWQPLTDELITGLGNLIMGEVGGYISTQPYDKAIYTFELTGSVPLHRLEVGYTRGAKNLSDVVHAPGQFSTRYKFDNNNRTGVPECYEVAERLLRYGPIGPRNLVFQSTRKQGIPYWDTGSDPHYSTTYFGLHPDFA